MSGLCRSQTAFDLEGGSVVLECEKRDNHKGSHKSSWSQGDSRGTVFSVTVRWKVRKNAK
jgi:hypothetical protein